MIQQALQARPSDVLKAFLIASSGALFSDPVVTPGQPWPLYVSSLPDGAGIPDDVAAVYDTEGIIPHRLLASGTNAQKFGLQLKARSLNPPDSFNLLDATAVTLSKLKRPVVAVGSTNFTVDTVIQTSPVLSIGQDERRRALHTVNFYLMLIGF